MCSTLCLLETSNYQSHFVFVCVCVWRNQLLPLYPNPPVPSRVCLCHCFWIHAKVPICCVSRFYLVTVPLFKTGCTFEDLSIVFFCFVLLNHCTYAIYLNTQQIQRQHISTYVFERTIRWVRTHDQQMGAACFGWGACLCVGARESYLCHHEYVIKLPLRKDDVQQQGVHEAGTRVLFFFFCFHWNLVVGIVHCGEKEKNQNKARRDKVKSRKLKRNQDMLTE